MRITLSRTALIGLLAVLTASVGAVVGFGRSATEASQPVQDIASLKFALDDYLPTREALLNQQKGRDILLDQCVERFTDHPYVPESAVGVSPAFSHYRFGPASLDNAKQSGYHDPADELGPEFAMAHPVSIRSGMPTPQWLIDGRLPAGAARPTDPAHQTLPAGGCMGEVDRLMGERPSAANVIEGEIEGILAAERSDRRTRDAIADWAACMHAAGYAYDNPVEPISQFGSDAVPSPTERATAAADVTCRVQTDYLARRVQILNELQRASLASHQDAWDTYREWQQRRSRVGSAEGRLRDQVSAVEGESNRLASPNAG